MATGPVLPAGPVATPLHHRSPPLTRLLSTSASTPLAPSQRADPGDPTTAPSIASVDPSHPGPEDALVDVIPHASTGGRAPRIVRATLPALAVAVGVLAIEVWGWWLHPDGVLTPAVAGAAGAVLVVLLLAPPRAWAAPLLAGALATAGAAAWHDAPVELIVGRAVAVAAAACATAILLRWYANGPFRLTRVRDLCTLVVAAAVGGVLGAAVQTLAVALERDPSAGDLWRVAWPTAIAIGAGMVLVPTALLTLATRAPASYLRGRDIEAALFVFAVTGVAVATSQVEDPLVFAGAVVLLWA